MNFVKATKMAVLDIFVRSNSSEPFFRPIFLGARDQIISWQREKSGIFFKFSVLRSISIVRILSIPPFVGRGVAKGSCKSASRQSRVHT